MKINELIKAVYESPSEFDFKKALEDHSKSDDYDPYYDDAFLREDIDKQLKNKRDKSLIEICYAILKRKPFDIESHVMISQAGFRLNKKELSQFHNYIASSLIDCILKSGNGKNYNSAYKIYHPDDEGAVFAVLQKYPRERVRHEKNGRHIDIYSFDNEENMFFDITIPFNHISGYV